MMQLRDRALGQLFSSRRITNFVNGFAIIQRIASERLLHSQNPADSGPLYIGDE